jgi:hypothetical protein
MIKRLSGILTIFNKTISKLEKLEGKLNEEIKKNEIKRNKINVEITELNNVSTSTINLKEKFKQFIDYKLDVK